jgi:hypothetical protein
MPQEKTEQEKFLEGVVEESVFDQPLGENAEQAPEPEKEDEVEEAKNRRERRLMAKQQALREENIALNERLKVISETQQFRAETDTNDYLKRVERIYGTNSPEAKEATEVLAEALKGVEERAFERARTAFHEEQGKAQEAVRNEEKELDSFIEELEDTNNVTFTPQMEKSYFHLMEKMSPKDRDGNIVAYADPHAVFEIFQERMEKQPKNNRARDLAARSMTTSAAGTQSDLPDQAARDLLREAGINVY